MNSMNMAATTVTPNPGPVEMPAEEREINPHDNDRTPTKGHHTQQQQPSRGLGDTSPSHGFELPDFNQFTPQDERGENERPTLGVVNNTSSSRPGTGTGYGGGVGGSMSSQGPPQIRLPGVDGRESLDDWDLRPGSGGSGVGGAGGGGKGDGQEDDDWKADAFMSMNLAGTLGGK